MSPKTTVHLSGPADLIATLPYQLGFHPSRCVVAVTVHGTRLGLVQRIDLPEPLHVSGAAAALLTPMRADKTKTVILVAFEDVAGQAAPLLGEVATRAVAAGITVADTLVVRAGRWYSLTCMSPSCCPPQGTALLVSPAVAAEFVGRGVNPAASRQEVVAALEAGPGAVSAVGFEVPEGAALAAWAKVLTAGELTAGEARAAAASLADTDFRDALVVHLCPSSVPVENLTAAQLDLLGVLPPLVVPGALERLVALCAALDDDSAAPALTVLAAYSWSVGDGALATIALERALRVAPAYRLAQLTMTMIELGIRIP